MCLLNLLHSDAETRSLQESQESGIPTKKFRKPRFLAGNSRFSRESNAGLDCCILMHDDPSVVRRSDKTCKMHACKQPNFLKNMENSDI